VNFFSLLKDKINNVIVIGVASDFCVKYALSGFLERGFKVITDSNLTAHIETPLTEVSQELIDFFRNNGGKEVSLELCDLYPKNNIVQTSGWFKNSGNKNSNGKNTPTSTTSSTESPVNSLRKSGGKRDTL
jgi:hypothetical protein